MLTFNAKLLRVYFSIQPCVADELDSASSSPSSYSAVSEVSVSQNGQFPFKDQNFEVGIRCNFMILQYGGRE